MHVYGADIKIIVPIITFGWRKTFQESFKVLDKKWFIFLNHDSSGRVSGKHDDYPVQYAG
jgi:hypothetical protein